VQFFAVGRCILCFWQVIAEADHWDFFDLNEKTNKNEKFVK